MKKGFTLVEVLAVIALLSIIAVIAIPSITNVLNNTQDKTYELTIAKIKMQAEKYLIDETLDQTITDSNYEDVYLNVLLINNYLSAEDLDDPRNVSQKIDAVNSYIRFSLSSGELISTENILFESK
ncbi:MAG: prepilin-type N-terminal cleavage/methylation domain-containing protein [Bacilli bacterium]|jgi:type IV pilus assembly protein PilA|nr:prepilin-type N-terminal cleavage/methylation domain-containing protein [Mollicutes bacterium]